MRYGPKSPNSTLTLAERMKDDFKVFLWAVWRALGFQSPTPIQYDIADFIQNGGPRLLIMAFRGVGKSYVTAAYVLWELFRDPQKRIMVVSAGQDRAAGFSIFVKSLIQNIEFLNFLAPGKDQRSSNLAFDVGPAQPDQSPSVKSVGITGQLTGSRADIIVPDDIETPKNSLTLTQRARISELVKEFDAVLKPGGRILYLGTPQCEDSLYNKLPERGYEARIWPVYYPDITQREKYGERLSPALREEVENDPSLVGTVTDKGRFSEEDIAARKLSYGRAGFALQFMLDTSLSDADKYPLKCSDFIVMSTDPEQAPIKVSWSGDPRHTLTDLPCVGLSGDHWQSPMFVSEEFAPYTGIVLAIDPSGRGKDETGYAVVAYLHGMLYVLDVGGMRGGYDNETLVRLAGKAKQYAVTQVIVEANFGDGMFVELFKPVLNKYHPCSIEEVKNYGASKEQRILDALEPVLAVHRLVLNREVITQDIKTTERYDVETAHSYQCFHQLTRITRDRGSLLHDDRLEALGMAVKYWTEQMGRDVEEEAEAYNYEKFMEDIERFFDDADVIVGERNVGLRWT